MTQQTTNLVLGFTAESKDIFGLAIGNLVNAEPFIGSTDETRKLLLNILDVYNDLYKPCMILHIWFLFIHTVKLRSKRIIDIDSNHLPVSFTFIQESHDTKDLDLLDLTSVADLLTNLNNINRIIVTLSLGLRMLLVGIFPSLWIKFGHEDEYNMHVN